MSIRSSLILAKTNSTSTELTAIWLPSACHVMYSAHAYKTIKWHQIELQADRAYTVDRFQVQFYSYKDDMPWTFALKNAVLLY